MKDNKIFEGIKADFASLWTCKSVGDTFEISTPYCLPDSTLLRVYVTRRGERLIVSDAGDLIEAYPESLHLVRSHMEYRGIKEGALRSGSPLFFKDTTEEKLLSSCVFDLIHFCMTVSIHIFSENSPR